VNDDINDNDDVDVQNENADVDDDPTVGGNVGIGDVDSDDVINEKDVGGDGHDVTADGNDISDLVQLFNCHLCAKELNGYLLLVRHLAGVHLRPKLDRLLEASGLTPASGVCCLCNQTVGIKWLYSHLVSTFIKRVFLFVRDEEAEQIVEPRSRIFSNVRPFYERAVSDLDP
jgi:hypothetical protein